MSGLSLICKKYGGMVTTDNDGVQTKWLYDYAADKAVKADEMPHGSERWKQSQHAKWEAAEVQKLRK